MPFTVEIGEDFGAAAVKSSNEITGVAIFDRGSRWQVALTKGGVFIGDVTDASGAELPSGVIVADNLGTLPTCLVTIPDIDEAPAEIWLHQVGAAAGKGWRRYRLGGGGTPSGGGTGGVPLFFKNSIGWFWEGSSVSSGTIADPAPTFRPSQVDGEVLINAIGGVPAGPTQVQLRAFNRATGVVNDIGPVITMPAGQASYLSPPVTADIPIGELMAVLVTAPPAGVAGGAPAAVAATAPAYNSAAATAASYTLPMPAGGVAGDMLLAIISNQAPKPLLGPAWTRRQIAASVASGTQAPRAQVSVWTAPWSAGMDMSVALEPYTPPGGTTATASPLIATVMRVTGADLSNPIAHTAKIEPDNSAGPAVTLPAGTAAAACDLLFVAATWHELSGTTGQVSVAAPAGTEVTDSMTSRASATNVGQSLTQYAGVASGAALPATTVTVSGGTGPITGTSMSAAIVGIRRAPASSAPVRINAWAQVKETA